MEFLEDDENYNRIVSTTRIRVLVREIILQYGDLTELMEYCIEHNFPIPEEAWYIYDLSKKESWIDYLTKQGVIQNHHQKGDK